MNRLLSLLCVFLTSFASAREPDHVVELWPGKPPGETKELPPEIDTTKPEDNLVGGKRIIKLTNVSKPTLSIYSPPKDIDTGASVIICPGGGHHILAFDHEGTEVAEWLNDIGVTGIVLKYRVPFRNPEKRWGAAVQDAQRAVITVRSQAEKWNLDPQRIGILGFSAGAQTAGLAALLHGEPQYELQAGDSKEISARPDFAVLIYGGGLINDREAKLLDYVKVSKTAPPTMFIHAWDDPVSPLNSILLAAELKKVGVPCEMHIYATGGHGYGIRDTGEPVNEWPKRVETWMKRHGWLDKPKSK